LFHDRPTSLETLPYLHVSAFKVATLVSEGPTHKVMRSSGTSGTPSVVHASSRDCLRQSQALAHTFAARFGPLRRDIVVVDHDLETLLRDGMPARAAAIVGFTSLSRNPRFLLAESDATTVTGRSPLVFGFTTSVWEHRKLLEPLAGRQAVVLHGGGWKRLSASGVSREAFNEELLRCVPDAEVVNYFGMIEQVGVVYFDCAVGRFHEHRYGTFIARDASELQPAGTGLGQFFSTVPMSYPGHSLLTDDIIEIEQRCECGAPGRAFRFIARREASETRGCANA